MKNLSLCADISEKYEIPFSKKENAEIKEGDLVVFSFRMKAAEKCVPLTISVVGKDAEERSLSCCVLPAVCTQYFPVRAPKGGFEKVCLVPSGKLTLPEASFENRKDASFLDVWKESGMWYGEPFENVLLPEKGVGTRGAVDLVKSGKYLFSIGNGSFFVTDVSDPDAPRVCAEIGDLGTTRQMDISSDKKTVIVTARDCGMYVIDVSEPEKPSLSCIYSTVELATGAFVSGHYAFVSCRQYGVEVIDISSASSPVHVGLVRTGEVQSCVVRGKFLYTGLWGEHRVNMYDISDLASPKLLGSVSLSGRGDGLTVEEIGGRTILFAATGHHSIESRSEDGIGFGLGNGVDIFDVTEPASPVWLSTVKTDGKFYYLSDDYWTVKYAEHDGHGYLYAVHTYDGVYVYNVDDLTSPVRLAHIAVEIKKDSAKYKYLSSPARPTITPYDREESARSAVGNVLCDDGVMYVAGVSTDVHVFKNGRYVFSTEKKEEKPSSFKVFDYTLPENEFTSFRQFLSSGSVMAAETAGGRIYAASGNAGIEVFDKSLCKLYDKKTKGIACDIAINGSLLYSAECSGGLCVYAIAPDGLYEKKRYREKGDFIRGVTLSKNGKYAVLITSGNHIRVINTESFEKLYEAHGIGLLYYQNQMSRLLFGRYVLIHSHLTTDPTFLVDFGEDDKAEPRLFENRECGVLGMRGGVEEVSGRLFGTSYYGCLFRSEGIGLTDEKVKASGYEEFGRLCGFITPFGKKLAVTDRIAGDAAFIDAEDPEKPRLLLKKYFYGNPARGCEKDGCLILPLGRGGLLMIEKL